MKKFVGLTFHHNEFTVCLMDRKGIYSLIDFELNNRSLIHLKNVLNTEDEVVVEQSRETQHFIDELKPFVNNVKVIKPFQFKIMSRVVKYTKENIAEVAADFLRKGLIQEAKLQRKKAKLSLSLN